MTRIPPSFFYFIEIDIDLSLSSRTKKIHEATRFARAVMGRKMMGEEARREMEMEMEMPCLHVVKEESLRFFLVYTGSERAGPNLIVIPRGGSGYES